MIEPRIYRAAFIPALFAIVLVAFSLETSPGPLPQGLAAEGLFDGQGASALMQGILQASASRRPGGAGDARAAQQVARSFAGAGFPTTFDHFSAGGSSLTNVVATKPGEIQREIVVVAGRDSPAGPDAATSAADTAALMEFAHVFQGSTVHHTLVLASVDGQTVGDAGARELAANLPSGQVDGAIVLSNLAADRSRGPLILNWSNSATRGSVALERTAAESLRGELAQLPHSEGLFGQFARLAFPIAPGAEGALVKAGLPAVRVSGSGELRPDRERPADVNLNRYGELGRGVLSMISALDATASPPAHGPSSYLEVSGQLLPSWALSVLALALMIPAFLTSVDALARSRRRGEHVAGWFAWVAASAVPFAIAYIAGKLFVLVGLGPYAPSSPLDPALASFGVASTCALVLTTFSAALAWIVVRPRLIRLAGPLAAPSSAGAACALNLVLTAMGIALAVTNPYTALLLVPLVHLTLLATLTPLRPTRAIVATLAGLIPLFAIALYYLVRFQLDPLHGADYLMLLVLGGQVGVGGTIAMCVLAGAIAATAAILRARLRDTPAQTPATPSPERLAPQRIFGPGGYAGPGALGGTESTLRR